MIGDAVLYAASRATHNALENVSRRLTWTAIAVVFLLASFILAMIALYIVLEPHFGALHSIGMIAGGCVLLGNLLPLNAVDDRAGGGARSRPWVLRQPTQSRR